MSSVGDKGGRVGAASTGATSEIDQIGDVARKRPLIDRDQLGSFDEEQRVTMAKSLNKEP